MEVLRQMTILGEDLIFQYSAGHVLFLYCFKSCPVSSAISLLDLIYNLLVFEYFRHLTFIFDIFFLFVLFPLILSICPIWKYKLLIFLMSIGTVSYICLVQCLPTLSLFNR